MASEMISASATAHKTDAIAEGALSSLPGDDISSNAVPVRDQELGTGSTFCGLGQALMPEKSVQMGPSSFGPSAKRGSQECQEPENFCRVPIPTEEGAQMEQPLNDLEVADGVSIVDDCDGVESLLLEARKRQLLDELEGGSIFRDIGPFKRSGGRTPIIENLQDVDIRKFPDGVDQYLRSSLKIKVIDETALIEPIILPGIGNARKSNLKEDLEGGKKAKRARKRGKDKGQKTGLEKAEGSVRVAYKSGDGTKRMYSRDEMETLRFVGVAEQRKLWKEIYDGLEPVVAREYISIGSSKQQRPPLRTLMGPGILGQDCGKEGSAELEKWQGKELSNSYSLGPSAACEDDSTNLEELEGEEDSEDSDEFYASIQRPAFVVEGEPNFEAGPPEDGLEYLRRVRWEAAQIPNVKVAKLDKTKLNKEQSAYMPVIPEIAKCPEYLMPSKQWEDEFLADFSKLRLAFSQAEASRVEASDNSELLKFMVGDKRYSTHLTVLGNLENETRAETNAETPFSKVIRTNSASGTPTLSLLLSMDSVTRVSNLRKRINALEATSSVSRDDCLWIFALCAAIDTPLHADTCATLRCLLRKCASLRAQKEEVDNEAIMLNILTTISGRFFGQSGSEI